MRQSFFAVRGYAGIAVLRVKSSYEQKHSERSRKSQKLHAVKPQKTRTADSREHEQMLSFCSANTDENSRNNGENRIDVLIIVRKSEIQRGKFGMQAGKARAKHSKVA